MPDELLKIYWDGISQMYNGANGREVWQLQTREALDRHISPGVYGRYIRATAQYGTGIDPETGWQREVFTTVIPSFRAIEPLLMQDMLSWDEEPGGQAHRLHANLWFTDNLGFYDATSEMLTARALGLAEATAAMEIGLPGPTQDGANRRFGLLEGQWNHREYALGVG